MGRVEEAHWLGFRFHRGASAERNCDRRTWPQGIEGEGASPVRGEIVENAASFGGRTTPSEDSRRSPARSAERRSANLCWPATASTQRGRAIAVADEGVHSAPRFPTVH